MVQMQSWMGYFFHDTEEQSHHSYLSPYPAVYHILLHVKQCGVTYVGLFKQVSLHGMQMCARERETRVVALTGTGRSNSEEV